MATRQLTTKQIVNLSADPASGTPGEIYYNTSDNIFKYYGDNSWVPLSGGGGAETLLGDSFPEEVASGSLFFNYSNLVLYIGFAGSWLQVGSVLSIDGGSSATTIFAGSLDTGGSAVEQEYYVDGGQSQEEQVELLA
jgi:hypothetical protein